MSDIDDLCNMMSTAKSFDPQENYEELLNAFKVGRFMLRNPENMSEHLHSTHARFSRYKAMVKFSDNDQIKFMIDDWLKLGADTTDYKKVEKAFIIDQQLLRNVDLCKLR